MQVLSSHGIPVSPVQTEGWRLFKSKKSSAASPVSSTPRTRGRSGRPRTPRRSQTAYFVYLLVGVHHSYAEAQLAYAGLRFAERLPVMYERNENGAGKCKTWLAVSRPFHRRVFAEIAQRQLALYAGEGAVAIRRGVIQ